MENVNEWCRRVWRMRTAIRSLVARELRGKYVGTYGGLAWALLQPLSVTLVFWLVFSIGFRAMGPQDTPYIVYFLTGYVAWHFLQDCVNGATSALTSYSFLIRKTQFSIEAVLTTKLLTALVEHMIFVLVVLAVVAAHGMWPGWSLFKLLYGFPMLLIIAVSLMLLVATASVLYPDVGQGVSMALNVWFWLTPIVWVSSTINPAFLVVLDWNPAVHLIEIYRQALAYGEPVVGTERSQHVFWVVAPALLATGGVLHARRRSAVIDAL